MGVGVTQVVACKCKWGSPIPEQRVAFAIKHQSQLVACKWGYPKQKVAAAVFAVCCKYYVQHNICDVFSKLSEWFKSTINTLHTVLCCFLLCMTLYSLKLCGSERKTLLVSILAGQCMALM